MANQRTDSAPDRAGTAARVEQRGRPEGDRTAPASRPTFDGCDASLQLSEASRARLDAAVQMIRTAAARTDEIHAAADEGTRGSGGQLPHLEPIQRSFGDHDVSAVQAHVGGPAKEASQAIGAEAYTKGQHVAFQRAPDLHTAAHEAAHVVQQRAGVHLKGGVGQVGDAYERHADAVADRVVSGQSAADLLDAGVGRAQAAPRGAPPVQRTPGAGYEDGNRPDPSTSTDTLYDIVSSADRILEQGDSVTFTVRQTGPAFQAADTRTVVSWEVVNDPAAVATGRVAARYTGPTGPWSWRLTAAVAGTHFIRARVQTGQNVAQLEFRQTVISNNTAYANVGNAAPAPLATIQDFIALVRRVEAAHGGMAWQDVASKLRKEYYPGARGLYGGIKAAFTWDDLIDEQEDMPPLQSPPVAASDIAGLRSSQTVTAAGGQVDIGHVLTGVDSMNFPRVAGIFDRHNVSGPAAATWSGDVGSALVHWATDAPLNDATPALKQQFFDRFANSDDLLGDYDGIAIADMSGVPATAPLSERLQRYYVTSVAQGARRRYHNFCAVSGFNVSGGQLVAAARTYIRTQVLNFSRAFNVKGALLDGMILSGGGMGVPPNPQTLEMTSRQRITDNVDWFVNHFIGLLEAGLASEPP